MNPATERKCSSDKHLRRHPAAPRPPHELSHVPLLYFFPFSILGLRPVWFGCVSPVAFVAFGRFPARHPGFAKRERPLTSVVTPGRSVSRGIPTFSTGFRWDSPVSGRFLGRFRGQWTGLLVHSPQIVGFGRGFGRFRVDRRGCPLSIDGDARSGLFPARDRALRRGAVAASTENGETTGGLTPMLGTQHRSQRSGQ